MLKFYDALKKGFIYIEKNKKVIQHFSKNPLYNDEPQVHAYSITFKSPKDNTEGNATGVSFNIEKALMKLFGETMERFALIDYKGKFLFTTFNSIKNTTINPKNFTPFSKAQLQSKDYKEFKFNKDAKFHWMQIYSFRNKKKVYIPAQLVYVPFHLAKDEPLIREMISTGAATDRYPLK